MSSLVPGKLRRNVEYRETISWNKFQDGFPNLCIDVLVSQITVQSCCPWEVEKECGIQGDY